MSTPTTTPSHERLMELAESIGINIPPTEGHPHACSHCWGFELERDLVQDWLLEALRGVKLSTPEIPGVPNAFRVDDYVDWQALAKAHPAELTIMDEWTATSVSLDIVEELRAAGREASLMVYAYVTGGIGRYPTFGIEAGYIALRGLHGAAVLAPYEDRIRSALVAIAGDREPVELRLSADEDFANWSFG